MVTKPKSRVPVIRSATTIVVALFLVSLGVAPAYASTVHLTPRTCGTAGAMWVYISATSSGTVTHKHVNGSLVTNFPFTGAVPQFHYTTAHYTKETDPQIILNPGSASGQGTPCDN